MHPFCHLPYNLDSFLYLLQCKCYTTYQLLGCNGYGVMKRKKGGRESAALGPEVSLLSQGGMLTWKVWTYGRLSTLASHLGRYYSIVDKSAKTSYRKKAQSLVSKCLVDLYCPNSLVIVISLRLFRQLSSPCILALLEYHFKSTTAWGA